MKNSTRFILILIGMITILISCEKENTTNKKYEISGTAQKGPYIVGTNITISELNSDLTPTGKNYYSTIIDKFGTFEIPDVELSSNYVKLTADGNYFHEISGSNVPYRLTLNSIANLNDSTTININILTHLETDRLEYLINNSGLDFNEAKSQAQVDILSIFNLNSDNQINSEYMDLTKTGNNNAKLLAISSIIQGNRTISELTEILTNIKTDIKEDGVLDNEEIQTDLRSGAEFLRLNNITKNLMDNFELDSLSDFQSSINYFLDNSDFESNVQIEIPSHTENRTNLLSLSNGTVLHQDSFYCIATNIHCENLLMYSISIEKESTVSWNYTNISEGQIGGWSYGVENNTMSCGLNEQDRLCVLPIEFSGTGKITLTLNIDADLAGWSHTIREYIIE